MREEKPLNFREQRDTDLAGLPDEELVAYVVRARAAGREDCGVLGVQILAYRHERRIVGFIQNQLGSKGPQVVEEVAARTIAGAIGSAAGFEGTTIGQFRAWLFVIARRRRADYLRKKRVDEVSLVPDFGEDEGEREIEAGDPISAVDDASVWSQAFGELGSDAHRLVVILGEIHDLPHAETAEHVNRQYGHTLDDPMTENNVSQILSRFRNRLDELLEEADDPAAPSEDD